MSYLETQDGPYIGKTVGVGMNEEGRPYVGFLLSETDPLRKKQRLEEGEDSLFGPKVSRKNGDCVYPVLECFNPKPGHEKSFAITSTKLDPHILIHLRSCAEFNYVNSILKALDLNGPERDLFKTPSLMSMCDEHHYMLGITVEVEGFPDEVKTDYINQTFNYTNNGDFFCIPSYSGDPGNPKPIDFIDISEIIINRRIRGIKPADIAEELFNSIHHDFRVGVAVAVRNENGEWVSSVTNKY